MVQQRKFYVYRFSPGQAKNDTRGIDMGIIIYPNLTRTLKPLDRVAVS